MRQSTLLILLFISTSLSFAADKDTVIFRMLHLHGRPALGLSFGFSDLQHSNVTSSFAEPGIGSFVIGNVSDRESLEEDADYLLWRQFNYLSVSRLSTDIAVEDADSGALAPSLWRIGGGWTNGYGYKIGANSAIFGYGGGSLSWSKLSLDNPGLSSNDSTVLSPFKNTFRFGMFTEGGIRLQATRVLMFDLGYECANVYRAHLFWKWLGSAAIEGAGQALVDEFVEQIIESTPEAVPVVSFILRNGISYAMYELRKDRMNWPFKSEPPLRHDALKFGVTFVF